MHLNTSTGFANQGSTYFINISCPIYFPERYYVENSIAALELIKLCLLFTLMCPESWDIKGTAHIYKSPLFMGHPVDQRFLMPSFPNLV